MEAELYDIYTMWHVPFWQKEWFAIVIGLIGFLLFVGIVFLLTRLMRPKEKPKSAWDVALANLDALKQGPHYSVHNSKEFYCALTDIAKEYVQRRYEINLSAMTDDEWVAYLKQHQIVPEPLIRAMDELIQGSVLIKFANDTAMRERFDDDLQRVIIVVRDSMPVKAQE